MLNLGTIPPDAQFLRGVSMRDILRRFGKVLTDQHGTEATFELSYPVQQIDMFLSHAWATPGVYKTIALLYYANKDRALCAAFAVAAAMWGLEIAGLVDELMTWQVFYVPGKDQMHVWFASYDYIPPCITFIVVLLFGQELPLLPSSQCFLDKCCIHQTDLMKKKAGIQLLGQFLQSSQKLLILWQPEYLTRLWCVYELAAFRHIKGSNSGLITFLPLKLPMLSIGLFFFHAAATTLLELTFPLVVFSEWHAEFVMDNIAAEHRAFFLAFVCWATLFFGVYLAVGYFLWRFCVSHMRDRHTLLSQLRNFTLDKTECKYELDRIFVEGQIREWFGSLGAFEHEVQTEVADLVEQQLAAKEAMPWSMIFVGALSHIFFSVSDVIDLYHRGDWRMLFHSALFGICLSCFTDAIAMSIGLRLAEGAQRNQTTCQKVRGGLQVAVLFAGTTGFSCFILSPALPTYVALPCFILCGLLTYILYGTRLVRRTEATVSALRSSRSTRTSRGTRSQHSCSSGRSSPSTLVIASQPLEDISTKDSGMQDVASADITIMSHSILAQEKDELATCPISPSNSPNLIESINSQESDRAPDLSTSPISVTPSIVYIQLNGAECFQDVCHSEGRCCVV